MKIFISEPDVAVTPVRYDGDSTIIVVFLSHVKQPYLKNFRCINCGKIVFQYTDKVFSLLDAGDIPLDKACLDVMCGRCKIVFRVV